MALNRESEIRKETNRLFLKAFLIAIPITSLIMLMMFTQVESMIQFDEWIAKASCDDLKQYLIDNIKDKPRDAISIMGSNIDSNKYEQVEQLRKLQCEVKD